MGIGNTKKQAEEAHREIQRLRQQLTTLQAEKERLEGELGRLRQYECPIPELKDTKPLVLYFGNESDRDEFEALIKEAMPNAVSKKV